MPGGPGPVGSGPWWSGPSRAVLYDPKPWGIYRITEETVRGGEPLWLPLSLPTIAVPPGSPAAPLRHRVERRSAGGS